MIPVLTDPRCVLLHGDSSTLDLGEHVVDAIVCDPPAGIGFMQKGWDADKGGRDAWIRWLAETLAPAFRALKPGGHALVWAIPRTSHWTAMALELAGFEIRDVVMHLFGTGFPKSLSVSKAIDDRLGVERRPAAPDPNQSCAWLKAGEPCQGHDSGHSQGPTFHAAPTSAGSLEAAQWEGWGTALKPAAEHWILVRKPLAGTVASNVLAFGTGGLNVDACRIGDAGGTCRDGRATMPNDAGWANMRGHGIAELNAGRWPANVVLSHAEGCVAVGTAIARGDNRGDPGGRRPGGFGDVGAASGDVAPNARVYGDSEVVVYACVPGCPVRQLDGQAGDRKSGARRAGVRQGHRQNRTYGDQAGDGGPAIAPSAGGASRFFYVAKPPAREREAGCDHLPAKSGGEATGRVDGSAGTQNPRAGAGRGGGRRNFHPTVKSIDLMRWLVRLITPPGGIVLDPFCGSGSTGVAALAEGAMFIGVELTPDYVPIAEARLRHALKGAA